MRQFDVRTGRCSCCGRHVQGRHPLQTSDALGAANVQLGPEALSLAAHLNKEMGSSHEQAARVLELGYGLKTNRSSLCRALMRLGEKAAPTYDQLKSAARTSLFNHLDETGWRVAGHLQWLWVAVNEQITLCSILPGRGFEQAASILGQNYEGFLDHDGWASYYRFTRAYHQTCLSHLIRRCEDLIKIASAAAARFPLAVMEPLHMALTLRDRHQAGAVSLHGLYVATGRLECSMDRLLARTFRLPANRRLAKHLCSRRPLGDSRGFRYQHAQPVRHARSTVSTRPGFWRKDRRAPHARLLPGVHENVFYLHELCAKILRNGGGLLHGDFAGKRDGRPAL